MNTVRDLLSCKNNRCLYSLSPYDTVATALGKMSDNSLGAVLVMDEGDVVGIFSERDYARKLLLQKRSSLVTPIHEVMVRKVIYVTPDYSLEECLALMTKKHIRHLPVIDSQGEVLSLISIEDVVEEVLDGKEFMISELTRYVTGTPIANYEARRPTNVRELFFIRPKNYGDTMVTA